MGGGTRMVAPPLVPTSSSDYAQYCSVSSVVGDPEAPRVGSHWNGLVARSTRVVRCWGTYDDGEDETHRTIVRIHTSVTVEMITATPHIAA